MYSRKTVGSRMDPWGTPAGYDGPIMGCFYMYPKYTFFGSKWCLNDKVLMPIEP